MSGEHVHFFFQLRDQLKLYHWQTEVYARHHATDRFLRRLDKTMDTFVEVYIGKYGRPTIKGKNATVELHQMTELRAVRCVDAAVRYLKGPLTKSLRAPVDMDLMMLRDDMIADLEQLRYLFTLH